MDQLLLSQEDALSKEELMQLEQEPAGEESEDTRPVLRQLTTGEPSAPSHILRLAYRSLPVAVPMMSGN